MGAIISCARAYVTIVISQTYGSASAPCPFGSETRAVLVYLILTRNFTAGTGFCRAEIASLDC